MTATLNFADLSLAEIAAIMDAAKVAKKNAQDAEKARYAELGRELVEVVLTEQPCEPSPTSSRVGRSTTSLPIEVDGRQYTYYVSIKDVTASDERQKAIEAGTVVLEKKKATTEEAPTEEPATDEADTDATVVTLPTKPAA